MSLLEEQAAFLKDVRKLLDHADEQKLIATAGELERKPEMQAIYVQTGASKTMDSMHLRRCAIDLNFFLQQDGQLKLLQTVEDLEPLGQFWERLDPRNRWGGHRNGARNTLHFERDLGAWPSNGQSLLAPQVNGQAPLPSAGNARPAVLLPQANGNATVGVAPVIKRGVSNAAAITKLQDLLVSLQLLEKASGVYDTATEAAVRTFQEKKGLIVDGVVGEKTWSMLTAETNDKQREHADRWLGEADLRSAAQQLQVDLAVIKAVYKVESAGQGFIGDKPKILFEGHIFWQRLLDKGRDPAALSAGNEDILYPRWTREFYVGGAGEWRRLERAEAIDHEAARDSASYGLFQILGEHWKVLGYDSVDAYFDLMCQHERDQLEAFCRFVTKTRAGDQTLVDLLRGKRWADFAHAYNGPRYRENAYDDKLRAAYNQYNGAASVAHA